MRRGPTVLVTVVVVLALEVVGVVLFRASGLMNVSAIGRPGKLERWLMGGTADRSVEKRAAPVQIDRQDPQLLAAGFRAYDELCVVCHAAPGLADSFIARGLNPPAPHLWTRGTQHLSDGELYWIVQNGFRMTGMPSFGPSHEDRDLRALVAFLRQLPTLGNDGYARLAREAGLPVPGGPRTASGGSGATAAPGDVDH